VNFEIAYQTLGIHSLRFDVFYLCCLYFKKANQCFCSVPTYCQILHCGWHNS